MTSSQTSLMSSSGPLESARWRSLTSPLLGPGTVRASQLGFVLFIVANAALYIRPADLISEEDLPIYFILALACLLITGRPVLHQLSFRSLAVRPITVSLLGLLAAVVLSQLSHLNLGETWNSTFAFAKKIAYYFLLVAIVDSPKRLRQFLAWFVGFILIVVLLGLLQYYDWIDVPSLTPIAQRQLEEEGPSSPEVLLRLCSVGVFHNPNDLARILLMVMPLALYGLLHGESRAWQCLCGLALPIFGFALLLTYSRGGFLGFLVGLGALFLSRFGWKKTLLLVALSLPAAFAVFQGRQTDLDLSQGTGQQRILLWSDGLQLFREAPLFGIGYGEYEDRVGLVAHNSFLQSYVELGFLGGSCFLAAFYIPVKALFGLSGKGLNGLHPDLKRMLPFLIAMFAGYAVSLVSSTRSYLEQTYLLLGLATIYFQLSAFCLPSKEYASRSSFAERDSRDWGKAVRFATRCNGRLLLQVLALSFVSLIAIDTFVRISAHYGVR